jgi:4,5-DOPA dioxygenase extradiol
MVKMKENNSEHRAQIVYFSHGGGPLPILGDEGHKAMVDFMLKLPSQLSKPDAILVISAHWEENSATLLGSNAPPMLYDYYGFPAEAYKITYPAPGNPDLANRIVQLLKEGNMPARIDEVRGFDHGLFIPLKLMYPQADIPSLQLSLVGGLDAAAHIALGKALRKLRPEKILVVGSGFSFHNLKAFSWNGGLEPDHRNDAFQEWLIQSCTGLKEQEQRERQLINWEKAPHARYCHPREEHLLPLHVCMSMAEKPAKLIFHDYIFGKRAVAFLW